LELVMLCGPQPSLAQALRVIEKEFLPLNLSPDRLLGECLVHDHPLLLTAPTPDSLLFCPHVSFTVHPDPAMLAVLFVTHIGRVCCYINPMHLDQSVKQQQHRLAPSGTAAAAAGAQAQVQQQGGRAAGRPLPPPPVEVAEAKTRSGTTAALPSSVDISTATAHTQVEPDLKTSHARSTCDQWLRLLFRFYHTAQAQLQQPSDDPALGITEVYERLSPVRRLPNPLLYPNDLDGVPPLIGGDHPDDPAGLYAMRLLSAPPPLIRSATAPAAQPAGDSKGLNPAAPAAPPAPTQTSSSAAIFVLFSAGISASLYEGLSLDLAVQLDKLAREGPRLWDEAEARLLKQIAKRK